MKLYDTYASIQSEIDERLQEFEKNWSEGTNKKVFLEMVFCLCTPQSDAHRSWRATTALAKNSVYDYQRVARTLKEHGVRFHKTKAKRIVEAYEKYGKNTMKKVFGEFVVPHNPNWQAMRDSVAKSIKGMGLKEASHFIRNLGFGKQSCILDRHILRRLRDHKVVGDVPKLNWKTYHEIENKMIGFAYDVDIPVEALDLVFWFESKGEIFK